MCNNDEKISVGKDGTEIRQPNDQDRPRGLGQVLSNREVIQTKQIEFNQGNSQGRISGFPSNIGGSTLGKILSQLEELEAEYDSYTGSHKKRLETRLKESKTRREQFFAKASALRDEILRAVQQQQEEAINPDALDEEE